MADYIKRLLLIAPFLIQAQAVMRKLLDDPGFTFWLFAKPTTTSGLYGSLANDELLSLRSVLNVPDMTFTGKKDGERLTSCLVNAYDVEIQEKSKAFVVSIDVKDCSVNRWSPQFFLQWYTVGLESASANEAAVRTCQAKLRQMLNLTRVARSEDLDDVLKSVHVATDIISRLPDAMMAAALSAFAILHGEDKPPADKVPAIVLQPVEGSNRIFRIHENEYLRLPARRKVSLNAEQSDDFTKIRKSILTHQMSAKDFKEMAVRIGGDLPTGMRFITGQVVMAERDAFREGAADMGVNFDDRLDAAASISVQSTLNLSDHQTREMNGIMAAVGRTPVFATRKELDAFKREAGKELSQVFKTETVDEFDSKKKVFKKVKFRFWEVSDLINVTTRDVVNQLTSALPDDGSLPPSLKYDTLLCAFENCARVMRSTQMQSDEAIAKFGDSTKTFVALWRDAFPNHVTPKVHVLETHAYEQLRRFGVLGLFSEDPIERLHHQHLVATRRACHIRNYDAREAYLFNRNLAATSRPAEEVKNKINRKRKRNFSEASKAKQAAKKAKNKEAREVKIEGGLAAGKAQLQSSNSKK